MFHLGFAARFERLSHWTLGAALLLGLLAGVLLPRMAVQAQAANAQTYNVLAGGSALPNTTILAFAPQSLTVHCGDKVTWVLGGFHNIHFEAAPSDLIITSDVGGQPLPHINPAVAFPNVKNGSAFQGGDANSGISVDPTNPMITFSLVMDVAPGVYNYFCDLHPGMLGSIAVVDDATAIPSPAEALTTGASELAADGGLAAAAVMTTAAHSPTVSNGTLAVKAGLQAGPSAVLQFFPSVAVIHAGESVTWSVADHSMEPHFVTWPSFPPGGEFEVIPQQAGPPILAMSKNALGSTASGSEIGSGDRFNSGFIMPGQSFTLKFTEPGVYNYLCAIHPGMQGVVVVLPAS